MVVSTTRVQPMDATTILGWFPGGLAALVGINLEFMLNLQIIWVGYPHKLGMHPFAEHKEEMSQIINSIHASRSPLTCHLFVINLV